VSKTKKAELFRARLSYCVCVANYLLLQQPPTFALQESAATFVWLQTLPLMALHESAESFALLFTLLFKSLTLGALLLNILHESAVVLALQQLPCVLQQPKHDF
jgi:hypothetical protein